MLAACLKCHFGASPTSPHNSLYRRQKTLIELRTAKRAFTWDSIHSQLLSLAQYKQVANKGSCDVYIYRHLHLLSVGRAWYQLVGQIPCHVTYLCDRLGRGSSMIMCRILVLCPLLWAVKCNYFGT